MSGFFDDLVAATTADAAIGQALAGGDDAPTDRQAVRTAAVLASAAVVSELARLADGGGRWTWQRLARPGAAAGDADDRERGGSLTRMLFGERAETVAGVIARDAGLAPGRAEQALRVSTETAASLLGELLANGAQPDLRAEADALGASGWGDWLATIAPPIAPPVEPVPAGTALAGATVVAPLPDVAPPAVASADLADDDERPSRRLLLAGAVTVVAAALVAFGLSTRFGGDTIDSGGATATTPSPQPEPAADGTDADLATDASGPAPASPVTTASAATASTAPAPEAPVGPTTYRLALADPQGSTDAAGTVQLDLDPVAGQICYQFQVTGLTDPFPGHIHAAPTGASGGITVDFGYLTGATPSGCVTSFPADVADAIRHPERHYVELHDTEYGFGLRSRLAEEPPATDTATTTDGNDTGTTTDANGNRAGGTDTAAAIVLSGSRVVLRGAVPDEATRSALLADTADLAREGIEVVDELAVQPGAPPPSGRVVEEEPLLFPFDSNRLPEDTARTVEQLARILRLRPQWRVTLVGNTDGVGDVVYNLTLSLRRAIAARDALVAAGVAPEAVTIRGDGPFAPVADNDTLDGRTRNRRIDVVIATAP